MRIAFIISLLACFCAASAQHQDLLRHDYYLEQSRSIDCDNTSGSNPEHAICLFKELTAADSLLSIEFDRLLSGIENEIVRDSLITWQQTWQQMTNYESLVCVIGAQGWMRDIGILHYRLEATRRRQLAVNGMQEGL